MSREYWKTNAYGLDSLPSQTKPFTLVLLQCAVCRSSSKCSKQLSTDCEIRSVFQSLITRNVSTTEIHRQISEVYDSNEMKTTKYVTGWEFSKVEVKNVHDEPISGRPTMITKNLVNVLVEKNRDERLFTTTV